MSSRIYQEVVNLVVRLSFRRSRVVFINVAMRDHCTLGSKFQDVAKFVTLTPLSLLIMCERSFPIVDLKISSLRTFALKSSDKMFTLYL
jgi:hypothetical protein